MSFSFYNNNAAFAYSIQYNRAKLMAMNPNFTKLFPRFNVLWLTNSQLRLERELLAYIEDSNFATLNCIVAGKRFTINIVFRPDYELITDIIGEHSFSSMPREELEECLNSLHIVFTTSDVVTIKPSPLGRDLAHLNITPDIEAYGWE